MIKVWVYQGARALVWGSLILALVVCIPPAPVQALFTTRKYLATSGDDVTKYNTTTFSSTLTSLSEGIQGATTWNDNGLRFLNITLDSMGGYKSVYLWLNGAGYSGTESTRIYVEYTDNSQPFTDLADFDARSRSTYYETLFTTPPANVWRSVAVTGLFSTLETDGGYSFWGNNVTLFLTHYSGSGYKSWRSYDYGSNPPYLEFTWYSSYYATFYTDAPGYFREWAGATGDVIINGTQYVFYDYGQPIGYWGMWNQSYSFERWYWVEQDQNSTTLGKYYNTPDNVGNITIWLHTYDNRAIQENYLGDGLVAGGILTGIICLALFLVWGKDH